MELPPAYDPKKVESRIYRLWEASGFFNPDALPRRHKKPFVIMVPPPNVTAPLHMGHALQGTIQDMLIRMRRMQGYKTLWLPGTDHAGIATQNVVEKQLKREGLTRQKLGREKFLLRVWEWKEKYGNIILSQFKKLGASLDWSRTRFTMDPGYVKAVETAFLHYYKKGWIYQGERTVNACPRCGTSLSDLEIEWREEPAKLYYITYGPFTLATVRPETKLGDTAVAVHPRDKRYKRYVGKDIEIQSVDGKSMLHVVADEAVDPKFGTGVIKVTPAHDPADWEIAQRHHLEARSVIGADGKMNEHAGKYAGMTIEEARKAIVEDMEKLGLIEKIEDYVHRVGFCSRCGTKIEPLLSKQWFLKMAPLAKMAIEAVKKRKVRFHPKRWERVYLNWLKNVRDWTISRQIWWGHKIPLEGVEDVLDTWFSSALWPFATLGWPEACEWKMKSGKWEKCIPKGDLKRYYPSHVLTTAREIINLWVARMVFSGLEFMGREPFRDVIIHATVLAREGKRMSKSLGTGVDPLDLISQYGGDATRFGLIWQARGTQDIRFAKEHLLAGQKFANKVWNVTRFVLMNSERKAQKAKPQRKAQKVTAQDKRILLQLRSVVKRVTADIEAYRFGQGLHTLYHFFWHSFADKYVEYAKTNPTKETQAILWLGLTTSLKLLHPFMPFVTEELWDIIHNQKLRTKTKNQELRTKNLLLIEKWPTPSSF